MSSKIQLQGLATVTSFGDNIQVLNEAIRNNKRPEQLKSKVTYQDNILNVDLYKVPHFELDIKLKPAIERRLSFYSRMCIQAVVKAMADAKIDFSNKKIGIIVGTSQGPTAIREKFNKKLYCEGATSASPTLFANSVHNSTASFIAQQLNILGPTLTIVNHEMSTSSALITASSWLANNDLDFVFTVVGDEIYQKELSYYATKKYNNLNLFDPVNNFNPVAGEGVACFIFSNKTSSKYSISIKSDQSINKKLLHRIPSIIDFKGCPFSGPLAHNVAQELPVISYGKQIGCYPTSGAIDLAIACYNLNSNTILATTSSDNSGIEFVKENLIEQKEVQVIQTGKFNEVGNIYVCSH